MVLQAFESRNEKPREIGVDTAKLTGRNRSAVVDVQLYYRKNENRI